MSIKEKVSTFINYFVRSLRLFLGPVGVCIYPISCMDYAKMSLQQKPFILALPLIMLRVISCNPIVALARIAWWRIFHKK